MNDVDRSFDLEKIEKYLSLLTDNDRGFVAELLNKTSYIKYAQFKVLLLKCVELFFNNIGNDLKRRAIIALHSILSTFTKR